MEEHKRGDNIRTKGDDEIVNFLSTSPGHSHEIAAQAEMMRRLKNAIEKLDKNTKNYSGKLIDLTILLFSVALIQIFVSIMVIPETWLVRISLILMVLYFIYFIIRRVLEKKSKN